MVANMASNPASNEDLGTNAPKCVCVFYSFHPGLRHEPGQHHTPAELFGNVLYKVVARRSAILRHRLPDFQARIASIRSCNRDEGKKATRHMLDILRQTLEDKTAISDGNTERFCIIIDRLDLCDFPPNVKLHHIMNELALLIALDSCIVKVLVVVDTAYADGDWDIDHLEPSLRKRIFLRKNWNQTPKPAYERIGRR